MVTALGIDVRTFTLVFVIGGAAAALAGALAGVSFGSVSPGQGLIADLRLHRRRHRRDVVVIGGMGSITGSAAAAAAVGLLHQFVNYYQPGLGDICGVALLARVLLVRPQGLASVLGRATA